LEVVGDGGSLCAARVKNRGHRVYIYIYIVTIEIEYNINRTGIINCLGLPSRFHSRAKGRTTAPPPFKVPGDTELMRRL